MHDARASLNLNPFPAGFQGGTDVLRIRLLLFPISSRSSRFLSPSYRKSYHMTTMTSDSSSLMFLRGTLDRTLIVASVF